MERAVALAKMLGNGPVDKGVGVAAVHQWFIHEDLVSIVTTNTSGEPAIRTVIDQDRWLVQRTGAWASFDATSSRRGRR